MTGAVHGSVRQQADNHVRLAALRGGGLTWRPSGQASLHGPLRELAERVDAAFVGLAEALWGAQQEWHPAALAAEGLQRVDYLHSFPHQATFPVRLDPREANLEAFRAGPMVTEDGSVALIALAPTDQVLTPAACHHVYADHEGEKLSAARYVTTRNTCFRQARGGCGRIRQGAAAGVEAAVRGHARPEPFAVDSRRRACPGHAADHPSVTDGDV